MSSYPVQGFDAWAEAAHKRIDGRTVVVSVSGGKDSTATCLLLQEAGIPFRAVHMSTKWEAKETDQYLADYLPTAIGVEIEYIGRPGGMPQLIRDKGAFPSRVSRFCTEELKVRPFQRWLEELGESAVNVVGIRRLESTRRRESPIWEWSEALDCEVWRPIAEWSYDDVIAIHNAHGVRPNPLYLRHRTRVGCNPCIFARKAEIRQIADDDPGAIRQVRELEDEIGAQADAREQARYDRGIAALERPDVTVTEVIDAIRAGHHRAAARKTLARIWAVRAGLVDDWRDFWWAPPAWFQNPSVRSPENPGSCWPIDKVVEWSRTSRGGRQVELFGPPESDGGCMRWGLCETMTPTPPTPRERGEE